MNASLRLIGGLLLIAGCATLPRPVDRPAERSASREAIERRASSADAPATALVEAAAWAFWERADLESAGRHLERALATAPDDPHALLLKAEIAVETGRNEEAVDALGRLMKAPTATHLVPSALQLYRRVAEQLDVAAALESQLPHLSGENAADARRLLLELSPPGDEARTLRLAGELGVVAVWSVSGPMGGARFLDASSHEAPAEVVRRTIRTPAVPLDLSSDGSRSDRYEADSVMVVPEAGVHIARFEGLSEADLFVDGVRVLSRRALPRRPRDVETALVHLSPGRHLVRVRFSRIDTDGFLLAFPTQSGAPGRLTFESPSPSQVLGTAALIDTPEQKSPSSESLLLDLLNLPATAPEAMQRVESFVHLFGEAPGTWLARISLTRLDATLPDDVRAQRLAAAEDRLLSVAPHLASALMGRFGRELETRRFDDAERTAGQLAAALGVDEPRVIVAQARLALSRGDVGKAGRLAARALDGHPERCEARRLAHQVATRRDAVDDEGRFAAGLDRCRDGLVPRLQGLRRRGDWAGLRSVVNARLLVEPASLSWLLVAAEADTALGDLDGARRLLQQALTLWPRRTELFRKLAELDELAGEPAGAAERRRAGLTVDSSDASFAVAHQIAKRDAPPLSWATRPLAELLARARPPESDGLSSLVLLDLAAIELQPDGSLLERIHQAVQVFDKRGIDRFGEVRIPEGAVVLTLRTVKPDGRVIDAQAIRGKESISLPNLEPGDIVDSDYLVAMPARPPATPGFQTNTFLFDGGEVPCLESTQLLRVPAGTPVAWDRQNGAPEPTRRRVGEFDEYSASMRDLAPVTREPSSISDGELLPSIELGADATPEAALVHIGEMFALVSRPTPEIDRDFARFQGLPQAERLRAVLDRLDERVPVASSGRFEGEGPTATLLRGSGNRSLLIAAALRSAGLPFHVVLARPFAANPHPFRFAHLEVHSQGLIRVEPQGAPQVWVDPTLPLAPFGPPPESLADAEAWVVPHPGEAPSRVTVPPPARPTAPLDELLEGSVDAEGRFSGRLVRTLNGPDAAELRLALSTADDAQRRQQQSAHLANVLPGAELDALFIDGGAGRDAPVRIESTLSVPGFVSRAGLPGAPLPLHLALQLLGRGERRTPLLMPSEQRGHRRYRLTPTSPVLTSSLPAPLLIESPFGRYALAWRVVDGVLVGDESVTLARGRIPPQRYGDFARFLLAIDAAQSARWRPEPAGTPPPAW